MTCLFTFWRLSRAFTARGFWALAFLALLVSQASAQTSAFEYPTDGQVLDHGGAYLARAKAVPDAAYYYTRMSQKIQQADGAESTISVGSFGQQFSLRASHRKHSLFKPNLPVVLQSWAYVNSRWVRGEPIGITLKGPVVDEGPLFDMNVLSITFLKTDLANPANWDQSRRLRKHGNASMTGMRQHIKNSEIITMSSMERGSQSINGSGRQSLDYNLIDSVEFNRYPPNGQVRGISFNPAYDQILGDMVPSKLGVTDFCSYINANNIHEVWIWTDHDSVTVPIESQMSSPAGQEYYDISNSSRGEDRLPHCGHTYVMYNFNFTRGPNEALHNHLHQLENIFGYHNNSARQDIALFDWEGKTSDPSARQNAYGHLLNTGSWANSCGDSHWSPNIIRDPGNSNRMEYIWNSNRVVTTDCSNWNPQGTGRAEPVSCSAWNCNELDFYVWWMQRIPGDANGLVSNNGLPLRNWWETFARYNRLRTGPSTLVDYSSVSD